MMLKVRAWITKVVLGGSLGTRIGKIQILCIILCQDHLPDLGVDPHFYTTLFQLSSLSLSYFE